MPYRIGLNGLGRIGRALIRILRKDTGAMICAVNDLADLETAAHLLRHDSIHGPFPGTVETRGNNSLVIDGRAIPFSQAATPGKAPWTRAEAQAVVEATGQFSTEEAARNHLQPGVERVIVTAVCPGADRLLVQGVHDISPLAGERVIATGSCTTHAAALPLSLLDRWYGVQVAEMTTVHCTTGSQVTIDQPHSDLRRSRSALLSMIPTSTSASQGLVEALPQLENRLSCLAIRVPSASVSLVEIVAHTLRPVDEVQTLATRLREQAHGPMRGLLGVSEEPLVSVDFKGSSCSSIVDLPLLSRPDERFVRLVAWYDNEIGYANRVADLLRHWTENQS